MRRRGFGHDCKQGGIDEEGAGTVGGSQGGVARLGCSRGCRAIANTIATAPHDEPSQYLFSQCFE
jgi:hypothetical protein